METNELNEEQRIQTLLTAYVLGEATDEERAEVERRLSGSEELRAERARLEATIGLVQTAMGADEELSPASSAALADAVARRKRATWYRSPVFRIAAAVVVMGLGYASWRVASTDARSGFMGALRETSLAQAPAPAGSAAPLAESRAKRGRPSDVELTEEDVQKLRGLVSIGGGGGSSVPIRSDEAAAKEVARTLDEMGYVQEEPEESVLLDSSASAGGRTASRFNRPSESQVRPAPGQKEVLGEALVQVEDQIRRQKDDQRGLRSAQPEWQKSQDEIALLEKKREVIVGALLDAPENVELEVVGGSGGGKPSSAPMGPSTVGPASPGSPAAAPAPQRARGAVAASSDDFFLGRGEKNRLDEIDGETLRRLEALGYADADDVSDLEAYEAPALRVGGEGRFGGRDDRERLRRQIDFILGSCALRPDERPRDMFFRFWGDNPFEWPAIDPLSTFSVDVDTASYTLARRYLAEGTLPEKAQIRTEEFVNYFDADVPAPLEETFAIATELAPSRFGDGPDAWMLRIAVRGKDVSREERQPLTLTFVIDVSGSMKENNRLELVKHALRLLLGQLDARDSISIVAFSKEARLILPLTSARNRSLIETAIHQLQPDGGTNAEAGLLLGYEQALAGLTENSHNRVVLLSDGVANIGRTDQRELSDEVDRYRRAGIYLNTVGVGMNNHNDALLEQLANKGDGICNYVDDAAEAKRALVDRFTGAFEPIARDVKIQVEFDPRQVDRYRLLGYENRAIADADFRNDAVDAGEVNAGHQVVALYELHGSPAKGQSPLATVRLRWKPPHQGGVANVESEIANEVAQPVSWSGAAGTYKGASPGYRRSVLVAQFAEFLRRSTHARRDSLDQLIAEAKLLEPELGDEDFSEFVDMAVRSHELILRELARYDDLQRALDSIRHSAYLQAQLEELNERLGRDRLHELDEAARRLEQRIEWMRARIGANEFAIQAEELAALERENARLREQVRRLLALLLREGDEKR